MPEMTPEQLAGLERIRVAACNAVAARDEDAQTGASTRARALLHMVVAVLECDPEMWEMVEKIAEATTPAEVADLLPAR